MSETIVVGTDGSPTAEKAVRHASTLAARLGASIMVVTVFDRRGDLSPMGSVPEDVSWTDTAGGRGEEIAARAVDIAKQEGVDVVRHRAVPGDPGTALLEVATEIDASIVVVGSRGMTGTGRLFGSVPNHVSHNATCDVLIVHTD
ncbi:MAG TPA: universal stress protein [Acidimicrobiales bacterium]|nr:universal stress protein [Acidimicrobiales bacterium]